MAHGKSRDVVRSGITHESITIDNTAGGKGLTAASAASSNRIFISAETADMRFRYDGGAPTTTVGHLLEPGDILILYGTENIKNFLAIRTGDDSGAIKVTYEA